MKTLEKKGIDGMKKNKRNKVYEKNKRKRKEE